MALFVALTGVWKTHLALDYLKRECLGHFDYVIVLCSTLQYNETYRQQKWFWTYHDIISVVLGNHFYDWIEKLGNLLAEWKTLFLIDDIIAGEILDKQRMPLLELAALGRHKGHLLWLLMQSYTAVPMNIWRQVKMLYFWHPKKQGDWYMIHEENNVIKMLEEVVSANDKLRQGKHTCLVMRTEHLRAYEIVS